MSNEQNESDAKAHPVDTLVMCDIVWSESFPPNSNCGYDHCVGVMPTGKFLLTWKGHKTEPWQDMQIGFDETPWGESFYGLWDSVEQAKEAAHLEMRKRLLSCFNT